MKPIKFCITWLIRHYCTLAQCVIMLISLIHASCKQNYFYNFTTAETICKCDPKYYKKILRNCKIEQIIPIVLFSHRQNHAISNTRGETDQFVAGSTSKGQESKSQCGKFNEAHTHTKKPHYPKKRNCWPSPCIITRGYIY